MNPVYAANWVILVNDALCQLGIAIWPLEHFWCL